VVGVDEVRRERTLELLAQPTRPSVAHDGGLFETVRTGVQLQALVWMQPQCVKALGTG